MTAFLIDGNSLSKTLRDGVVKRVSMLDFKPGLAVILVGNNTASEVYVRNKIKACKDSGFLSIQEHYPKEISGFNLIKRIDILNRNPKIHGILVQLPLPEHIDKQKVIEAISPEKDVDGLRVSNLGTVMIGNPIFKPCTPYGIMKIFEAYDIPLQGKHSVVIGRSNIVGRPMAMLLVKADSTVTICHTKTLNLKEHTSSADIIISAIGKRNVLTADMIKQGATIIDVGINRDNTGKLCGDVDFSSLKEIAGYITPVPGGVGPMTVTMLLINTIEAAERQSKKLIR